MTSLPIYPRVFRRAVLAVIAAALGAGAPTGSAAPKTAAPVAGEMGAPSPVALLAWLEGCWRGEVNQREFREHWMPMRGGILIGTGQQSSHGQMQDYEFLRIEARPGGVFFTQFGSDRKEISFRLDGTSTDGDATIFTFANTADSFPARLVYRRGTDGWLYETIEGTLNGAQHKVIYPLRRVDCENGEFIRK